MLEVMMTPPNMHKHPTNGFEFGDDVATIHALIIHIIHTASIQRSQPTACVNCARHPQGICDGGSNERCPGMGYPPAQYLNGQIERITEELRRMGHAEPWAGQMLYLMQIPGFGVVAGMTVLAGIGDIARFGSPKRLASEAEVLELMPDLQPPG